MKIAITGASGHIGNNLCRLLLEKGNHLKVLINKTEKSLEGLSLEKVYGNILDINKVDELIKDTEYVFHAAALISIGNEQKSLVYQTNTQGTKNVVDACLKYQVKRLIHFSSIHALHANNPDEVLNENNSLANSRDLDYDKSKALGETFVLEACSKGLDAIILNPASVVGPFDYMPSLVGQMLIKIAKGKLPFLIKGGYHFVDVRDVAETAINAMTLGQSGQRYLLTSQWKSLLDVAKLVAGEQRKKVPAKIPTPLAWIGLPFIFIFSKIIGAKPLYTKESLKIIASSPKIVENKKAVEELKLMPRLVDETFRDALSWFIKNNYI
jgi:dihydroflavonol-4-reductase